MGCRKLQFDNYCFIDGVKSDNKGFSFCDDLNSKTSKNNTSFEDLKKGFSFVDQEPKKTFKKLPTCNAVALPSKGRINAPEYIEQKNRYKAIFHGAIFFREYDPIHGRWLSEDPAGYRDGLNLYAAYMGVNGIDPLGLNAIEGILKENPEVAEIQYTIFTLREIQKNLNSSNAAKAEARKEGTKNIIGIYLKRLAASRDIGREIQKLNAQLSTYASRAKYDVLVGVTGTSWYGQFKAASIIGVNGYGLKGINEAFNKDTIFARHQGVSERIFKGFLGVVELASVAIPVGRLGGGILSRLGTKYPSVRLLSGFKGLRLGEASPGMTIYTKYNNPILKRIPGLRKVQYVDSKYWLTEAGKAQSADDIMGIISHESKHVSDFTNYPQLTHLASGNKPGAGIARYIMEYRGYAAEGGKMFINPLRPLDSFAPTHNYNLIKDLGIISAGIGGGIYNAAQE